ncbi:MAG: major capsid protein P2 [Mariprofundus sp.]|nr:major capsid protein P2 [Mariprofundus sp.]
MSLKITDVALPFNGVAAGATPSTKLPTGLSYEQFLLIYGGATLAQINRIVFKANGKPIIDISSRGGFSAGQRLDRLNKFDGRGAAAGILIVDFNRFGLRTRAAEEITKLGTGIQGSPNEIVQITCEVTIDAAALNPTLSGKVIMSDPDVSGKLKHVHETMRRSNGAGVVEIADIPFGQYDAIQRITFENATALGITEVEIMRDRRTIFKRTVSENNQIQSDGVRVPQADIFVFDPTEAGFGEEILSLAGVQSLQLRVTVTAAGDIPMILEYLGDVSA